MKKAFLENRNTTAAGIAMILIAVGSTMLALFDGDVSTSPNWNIIVAELITALGLIVAGDGGK